jgi:hypothetical protein
MLVPGIHSITSEVIAITTGKYSPGKNKLKENLATQIAIDIKGVKSLRNQMITGKSK